ncbi:hypothetical protein CDAR_619171 [Caerostris darwini]|uniref:Uncharacterized protein n=1 Tax=Caerostris darwini TaxID=1538125 RepID=A0AAV4U2K5_9ARAC|nr:hypothetical protein CDAR_619171 [Caerostris darwini]
MDYATTVRKGGREWWDGVESMGIGHGVVIMRSIIAQRLIDNRAIVLNFRRGIIPRSSVCSLGTGERDLQWMRVGLSGYIMVRMCSALYSTQSKLL